MAAVNGSWSERLQFAAKRPLSYYIFRPAIDSGHRANMTAPLFVWLHGGIWCAGGRDPGEPDVPQNAIHCNEHQLEHRAFVLRPIALRRGRFSVPGPGAGSHPLPRRPSPSLSLAGRLVDYVLHHHAAIDPQRVVAAGASMGSYGLWDLSARPIAWRTQSQQHLSPVHLPPSDYRLPPAACHLPPTACRLPPYCWSTVGASGASP